MKKAILFCLFISFLVTTKAQEINYLKLSKFNIEKNGFPLDSLNIISHSQSQLIGVWGNPQEIITEYSEENEKNTSHLKYEGMDVWFMDNKLIGLNIKNSAYILRIYTPLNTIKVGDNISILNTLFPYSWATKRHNQVFIGLKGHSGNIFDMGLVIDFNPVSGLITEITIQ